MSSDLLEQAMIDAAALKEAAMKNAENALIEKYSAEFNQTVQKLLEQEDSATPLASSAPADANAMPLDVSTDTESTTDTASPDLSAGAVDPMAGSLDTTAQPNKTFSKVPGSFSGNDDELITINFDQIRATLNEMLGVKETHDAGENGEPTTGDALDSGGTPDVTVKVKSSKNSVDDTAEELEWELEEESAMGSGEFSGDNQLEEIELSEEEKPVDSQVSTAKSNVAREQAKLAQAELAAADKAEKEAKLKADLKQTASAATAAKSGTQTSSISETIELTEEELQELAEELKVDLKVGNLSDGYMGSTETQKREQRNLELAAARDEKATADREAEKQKMADLMKENSQLKKLNNDALTAVETLKEQIGKLNVLNAKLLYTNKALGNISLNERQKNNIVESISKADSVLAAKTIYETVQNAVENIAGGKQAPQSLRETINRAATPYVVKKTANNSINDLMAERLKALAGIKKLS